MSDNALQKLMMDTTVVGEMLATAVAGKLQLGHWLGNSHRDYCGMGLQYRDGQFIYGEIWDSIIEPRLSFERETDFVVWLEKQSTASLSRLDDSNKFFHGNQTLTRKRLEDFLKQT